jgi:hypothetical protein
MPKPKAFRTDKLIMARIPDKFYTGLRGRDFWVVVNKDPRPIVDGDHDLYKLFLHIGHPVRCDYTQHVYPHVIVPGPHLNNLAHLKGVKEVGWRLIERWTRDREKFLTLSSSHGPNPNRPFFLADIRNRVF